MGIGFAVGLQAEVPGISAFARVRPAGFELASSSTTQIPDRPRVRLASLEVGIGAGIIDRQVPPQSTAAERVRDAFDSLESHQTRASFEQRFAVLDGTIDAQAADAPAWVESVSPHPASFGQQGTVQAAARQTPERAPAASSRAAESKKQVRAPESKNSSLLANLDNRTAIYDITARKVYLPNGQTLEAHSGLGNHMDDPRYVNVKSQGPTPPNVYALSMREQLFHGVRALRLTPVGGGNMYGRDGILAHSYMLGENGQSNGCVSFSDYSAFLNAYLNGQVERLVVVEHLSTPPNTQTASDWLSEGIRSFFGRS